MAECKLRRGNHADINFGEIAHSETREEEWPVPTPTEAHRYYEAVLRHVGEEESGEESGEEAGEESGEESGEEAGEEAEETSGLLWWW